MTDSDQPLRPIGMLAYCSYAMPVTALPAVVMNLVPPYYAETFGLSLAAVGGTFFVLRLFDAITDPFMGWWVDRRPFGRAHKPWILAALPVFLLGMGLLFFPPAEAAGVPYLFVAGFITYSAYTIGLVTHQAWGAALARSPASLSRLFGYREVAVIAGILGAFMAPAIGEGMGYTGIGSKLVAASVFIAVALLACTAFALIFAPDPDVGTHARGKTRSASVFLRQRDFIALLVANLSQSFAMVSLSVLSYFLAAHAFGEGDRYGLAITIYFLSAGLAMGAWMRLVEWLGERKVLVLSCVYATAVLIPLPFWVERVPLTLFMGLLGPAFGAAPFLIRSMIGTLVHEYEQATGEGVRGTAYAAATFCDKLGSGLAAGIVLPLVGWMGFDPDGTISGDAIASLVAVAGAAPIAGFAVAILAALVVPSSERSRSVRVTSS